MSRSFTRFSFVAILALGFASNDDRELLAWQDLTPAVSTAEPQVDRNQNDLQGGNRNKGTSNAAKSAAEIDPKASKAPPAPVPKQRIEELFSFVEQHHPEIKPLLRSLQKKQRAQFQTAMKTLDREVRVLQLQKEKAPERYELSLELWISRSKTKFIAAQIATAKSVTQVEKLRKEMKAQIDNHYDIREKQLKADLAASRKRTERIESQINELGKLRENEIKRQTESATRMNQKLKRGAAEKSKDNAGKGKSGSGKSPSDLE